MRTHDRYFLGLLQRSAALAAVTLLAACATQTGPSNETADPSGASPSASAGEDGEDGEDEIFEQTVVTSNPDGTFAIERTPIAKSTQLRQREFEAQVRDAEARGVSVESMRAPWTDATCPTTALRMWDQPGYVGNIICFSGTGGATLSNFVKNCVCASIPRCNRWYGKEYSGCGAGSLTAYNKVASLKAGNQPGAVVWNPLPEEMFCSNTIYQHTWGAYSEWYTVPTIGWHNWNGFVRSPIVDCH